MRTKVVSFFIFFQELSNKQKIKALRPNMTKIASRGGGGPALKEAFHYPRNLPFFSDLAVLNQTFLRAVGGLAGTPCRWRVNRPSSELVVNSFQLYFGHG